ncbi:MAG: cytochrome c biogenesis protein ResB [Dermatophilaceae bacterium]
MSQDVRERPTKSDADQSLDGLDGGPAVAASDITERIWGFFISMRTGLLLILALGVLSLIGTLLVQTPAGLASDPADYAGWLASIHSKYGGWTPVFDKLGFFAVFTSIWFKAVMVLLTTSVLACSINRAPRLWKLAFHPHTRMGQSFFTHAPLGASVVVPAEPDETTDYVREVLKAHRFRTVTDPDDGEVNLYADRFRWGPFGTVMAHVSFVIILLGFFLSATTGFKNTGLVVPVGSTVQVGNGTGLSVKAVSFNDAYYPDGSPSDYASDLILYKNGAQVERQTIRVNHPMKAGGVSFFQSFFGEAAAMKVTDGDGKTLYHDAAALQYQSKDGTHSIGKFDIKGKGLTVYVVDVASGRSDPNIKAGQLQLEVDQAGKTEPVATQVVDQGSPTTIAGLTYTFERTRQYTGLIVAHDPGAPFVWVGSTLLVLGLFMVFFFPHRRVWVRIRKTSGGSEVLCASTIKRDLAFKPQFHQIVTDIQLATVPSDTIERAERNDA